MPTGAFNHFARLADQIERAGQEIDRETITEIASDAERRAPRRTGHLASTISAAETGVEVGADYAPYVEYGTSDTAAQPFLTPAAEQGRSGHVERWRHLEDRLR